MTRTVAELANVRLCDMTQGERDLLLRVACTQLERELNSPAVQTALKSPPATR